MIPYLLVQKYFNCVLNSNFRRVPSEIQMPSNPRTSNLPRYFIDAVTYTFSVIYTHFNIPFPVERFGPTLKPLTKIYGTAKWAIDNCLLFLNQMNSDDNWKKDETTLDYPNKGKFIDVFDFTQDLSTIENYSWTPLKINDSLKKYLTPFFGESSLLDGLNKDKYIEFATNNYPTNEQKQKEIEELNVIYKNLDDVKKSIAEYFEGGPGTVSPPGQWNIFFFYALSSLKYKPFDVTYYFYILNTVLYNSAIVTWKVKKIFLQSRPIQDIRKEIVTSLEDVYSRNGYYDDPNNPTKISKNQYLPYQIDNFVTPPFPDYTSGHSAFSNSAATIINHLLNFKQPVDIDFIEFSDKHKKYIAKFLENSTVKSTVTNVNIQNKSSLIDSNIPNCNVSLLFNSWEDIAFNSGMSRIYGGIHTNSSNIVGLHLGKMIAEDIIKIKKL